MKTGRVHWQSGIVASGRQASRAPTWATFREKDDDKGTLVPDGRITELQFYGRRKGGATRFGEGTYATVDNDNNLSSQSGTSSGSSSGWMSVDERQIRARCTRLRSVSLSCTRITSDSPQCHGLVTKFHWMSPGCASGQQPVFWHSTIGS